MIIYVLLTLAITSGVIGSEPDTDDGPLVTLPNLGILQGTSTVSAFSGRTILQFLSVKYAETTSGVHRFKPPRKAIRWEGIRNVARFGLPCPQLRWIAQFSTRQFAPDVEDCLTLSVHTANLSSKNPVIFFIHGGGFYDGSGAHHTPQFLLEKDIVLVVVQYRLGPLGFASLRTEGIPGNVGLMDIELALRWVQENIEHFGGDARNVTVFGESAGAAAISALMYSPRVADNLFHKVILQSGASSAPWVWDKDPVEHVREIATIAGCDVDAGKSHKIMMTSEEAERCFRNLDVWTLLRSYHAHDMRTTTTKSVTDVGGSRLVVGDFHGFIPQTPWELIKAGKIRRNISMMAGVVKHEGTFLLTVIYDALKDMNFLDDPYYNKYELLERVNKILGVDDPTGMLIGYQIRSLFTMEQLSSGKFEAMAAGLTDLAGAALIKAPVLREAQANSVVNSNGTFLYSFDYRGQQTRFGFGANTTHYPFDGGVHHEDDLLYLFPFPPGETKLNEEDSRMVKLMVELWTSFATTGVPQSAALGVKWENMRDYAGPYLHIDAKPRLGANFYEEFTVASDEKNRAGGV